MAASGKVAARTRARTAAASLLAKRRERDRLIEDRAAAYFLTLDQVEQANAALEAANQKRIAALGALVDLELTNGQLSELCGVDLADIRAARRHQQDTAKDSPPASTDSPETTPEQDSLELADQPDPDPAG